jgi:DNA topoisomerase-1
MLAAVELRRMGPAASRREADRNIIAAIDAVAERLGNTRAVCRKYYVHPALLQAYLMGRVAPAPPPARPSRPRRRAGGALRRDEVLVLQFLQSEM